MQTQKLFKFSFSNPLLFSVGHDLSNIQIIAVNEFVAFEKLKSYMRKKGYAITETDIGFVEKLGESAEMQDCLPILFFVD